MFPTLLRASLVLSLLAAAGGCKGSDPDTDGKLEIEGTYKSKLGKFRENDKKTADGAASNTYRFQLKKGQTVTLLAKSTELDVDARVLSAKGEELAKDADSAGGNNARIVFTSPEQAFYRLEVRTKGPGFKPGSYTVVTREGTFPDAT